MSPSTLMLRANNVYVPYFKNISRYLHLWGGSGSGKSVFAAQKVITRIVEEKAHRILCVRKVANTLRSSVFQLLKDQISEMGFNCDFEVNKTEMRFTHFKGGELLLAGLDDVERLKSITGITSIWIEEATELSAADFDQLDLRLRGETPFYKQIIFTYNPIDERHWIKARFHDPISPQTPEGCTVPPLGVRGPETTILQTTFKHNRFIDAEYKRVLEQKAMVNPNLYRIYYMGEWGKEEVQRPYVYNFDPQKTIDRQAVFQPHLQVCFSIDFNLDPFVCICSHIWNDHNGMHFHIFKELVIEKNGDVYKMLELLITTFGMPVLARCLFTGDAMQRKREVSQRNNISAWVIIDKRLNLGRRLLLPNSNPLVKENRHLVNAICAFHPDFKIHPDCKKLIYDLQFVEADEEGGILKSNRNRQEQRADALDTFRYLCNTHLPNFLTMPWKFGAKVSDT